MQDLKRTPTYGEGLRRLTEQLSAMIPGETMEKFGRDARQLQDQYPSPLRLHAGDTMPSFTLPNSVGKDVSSDGLLRQGRLVLIFYRGTWCPYCNLQLATYQGALDQIKLNGANLVAISPQTPDQSLNIQEKNNLAFQVLSDKGNQITRKFTTIFRNADEAVEALRQLGINYDSYYEDPAGEIGVPAVFVVDTTGVILFARSTGGDYRERVEPAEVIKALANGS